MDFKSQTPPVGLFEELRTKMFLLMKNRHYSQNAINTYRKMANVLEEYLAEHNTPFYNREIGNTFLAECRIYRGNRNGKKQGQSDTMRTMVYYLNDIIDKGEFGKPSVTRKYPCPELFLNDLNQYLDYQRKSGKQDATLENVRSGCAHWLCNLSKLGITTLFDITPQKIFESLEDYPSKVVFSLYVPQYLKYLYQQGILDIDHSSLVPSPTRAVPMPTVYEKGEIKSILSSVGRTSSKEKRDYAMLLLSARLGLRVSDIIALTFNSINYKKKTIEVIQQKTGVPLILPMSQEIENAICEYIKVRPKSIFEEIIFLRSRAPYHPLSRVAMYRFMQKYFQKAGIEVNGRKHGPHSLRSSLASALVAENVPYAVTQKILGHTSSSAIKHYVRLDTEQLRNCALDVPLPSGNFSTLLSLTEVSL